MKSFYQRLIQKTFTESAAQRTAFANESGILVPLFK